MNAVKRIFRIQYASDLHLEFLKAAPAEFPVKPAAPYLALAGDICPPSHFLFRPFMRYVSSNWEAAFYVAGNHEYYGCKAMSDVDSAIKAALTEFPNIHFLDMDRPAFQMPDQNVVVLGTTLWTHIPDDMYMRASRGMNDYYKIGGASPTLTTALHATQKQLLRDQIDCWKAKDADIVVLTHHMPSYSFIHPRYAESPLSCCFASDCTSLLKEPHVRAWIYGHTHDAATHYMYNTIAAVNSGGYPGEKIYGYKPDAYLEFKIGERGGDSEEVELL